MTVMTPAPIDQQQEDEEMLVPHTHLAENNHQPKEVVAQPETANTVDSQPVEDPSPSRFTWRIDNFTRMNNKKLYSDAFVVGGYKWRVLIFPKGNNVDYLSMYLDVADSASLPYGWSRYAQFSLAVVNQIHNKYSVRKDTQHQFNARESDSGFTSFMPLGELYDPSRGYLVNDTLVVEAEVLVRRIVDYWSYDSKETGYVGLKNQGATCYMNSLLQTLYHIPYFRKAVYHMPTTENDMPSGSIPLAMQSLFYKLQYSDTSVTTKELTKSFGWDTYDSFLQHDVQELNRVLCEKLEDKMKGTVVEGTIQKLFEGHHMNYIECINVDYKSTRKESFYDLQLDVKGCRDVYESFDKYVEVESLEGDNKYQAEQYGLQDAKKGVLFIDFPPVLQLQLKRFDYDFVRDTRVKINDHYEFPLQLDLDRENGKYLSPDADRNVRNLYTLHSVLVHSGGAHGGHYYAFIRPTLSDQWYRFDDERVTKEDGKRALDEQYGGEEELPQTNPGFNNSPFKFTKYSNAYMLVYIREADKDKVICNVDEKDIAEHLRERLKKKQEEKEHKKKEKAEAHLYTIIKVARDEDLAEQIGKDTYFDLLDHDKVRSFRVQKQMSFNNFKEVVAKEFDIQVQFQRFWLWAKRQNHMYRPNRPLTPIEEAQSVGQLREVSNKVHNAELKWFLEVERGPDLRRITPREKTKDEILLFLEVERGPDLRPITPREKTKDEILLFFKLYVPEKEELRYVGRLFVNSTSKPSEYLTRLNEMAGYDPDEEIGLYEEIMFEPTVMCEPIDKKLTFRASQLEDGDIICFQKASAMDIEEHIRYPDVPSYLEYVHNTKALSPFGAFSSSADQNLAVQAADPPSSAVFPDDIISEILSFADVKSLLKLRCVCKFWKSLISHPKFVQSHLKRSLRKPHLALFTKELESDDWSVIPFPIQSLLDNPLNNLPNDPCYQLVDKSVSSIAMFMLDSCNGLICLEAVISEHESWFCLWNPATRKVSEKFGYFRDMENSWFCFRYMFGYDKSSCTYKLVTLHAPMDDNAIQSKTQVRVFSLSDKVWRVILTLPLIPRLPLDIGESYGADFDGSLNWLSLRTDIGSGSVHVSTEDYSVDYRAENVVIASLDLTTETCTQFMPPPSYKEGSSSDPHLCVLLDCLCFSHDVNGTHLLIWKMKEIGVQESWTQFLNISYENLDINYDFGNLGNRNRIWTPLHISANGDAVIFSKFNEDEAIIYNLSDNSVKKTRVTQQIHWSSSKNYVESLVSPL